MARKEYTPEEKTEFISVANEMGIGPAMRELGYPGSHHTAGKWFREANVEMPTVSYLQRQAQALGQFYTDKEELAAIQLLLDRYTEAMVSGSLDSDALNKLANGLQKVIQTKRLIEGKTTNASETISNTETDKQIERLVKEFEEAENK